MKKLMWALVIMILIIFIFSCQSSGDQAAADEASDQAKEINWTIRYEQGFSETKVHEISDFVKTEPTYITEQMSDGKWVIDLTKKCSKGNEIDEKAHKIYLNNYEEDYIDTVLRNQFKEDEVESDVQ